MEKERHSFSIVSKQFAVLVVSLLLHLHGSEVDAQTPHLITTFSGGSSGFSGDGGLATSAQLNPESENFRVALDANGDVYIADVGNHRIRKITVADGIITTVAGNGVKGFAGDEGSAIGANLNKPSNAAFD
jgi:hypothetical protein